MKTVTPYKKKKKDDLKDLSQRYEDQLAKRT
jgi:hypothetical protein